MYYRNPDFSLSKKVEIGTTVFLAIKRKKGICAEDIYI